MYRAKDTPGLRSFLIGKIIEHEYLSEAGFDKIDPDRQEQLQAVKRWFYNDWRRIEPKLRTSIAEGISVFLSLFDDNPAVKRTFCPPSTLTQPSRASLALPVVMLQSDIDLPYRAVKMSIGDSLNVIIHIERHPGRRFVSEVIELTGYAPDIDLFNYSNVYLNEGELP